MYKEKGMTSFDVIAKLRKYTNTRKIGHSGTLDPNAEGVMLVFFGNATKLLPYIEDSDKEYIATMKLGVQTTTDDIYGDIIATQTINEITDFDAVLQSFKGIQQQYPPMISNVKINGMKLMEYARKQIPVERPLRTVEFYDLEILDVPTMKFRVHCSSGTYIRSLCVDIGLKTNNLACMESLIRTKVGKFKIEDCYKLDAIQKSEFKLLDSSVVLGHFPQITIENSLDAYHGKRIKINTKYDMVLIVDEKPIALYKREKDNIFRSERGLW